MAPKDPRQWTPRQRAAYLAGELCALLDTMPTARSSWMEDAATTAEREQRAREISDRMAAVEESGRA